MVTVPQIILDINGAGPILARVELNGIFLAQNDFSTPERRALRINSWVVDGVNTLQVRLVAAHPPPVLAAPGVEAVAPSPVTGTFELKLRRVLAEQAPEDEQILADYTWSPAAQPLVGRTPIMAFSKEIKLASPFAWLWTTATRVSELSAGDKRDISALIQELHNALTAKAIPDLLRLQSIQVQEQAVAIGEDGQQMLDKYAEFLQERMAQEDWQVMPIDWEQLRPVRMASGRVYRVDGAHGEPPIVTNAGGSVFALQPYIAKIEQRWLIVR